MKRLVCTSKNFEKFPPAVCISSEVKSQQPHLGQVYLLMSALYHSAFRVHPGKERKCRGIMEGMYELIQAGQDSFFIDCLSRIGVVRTGEGEAVLIDSGSDKDAGRRIRQILDREGWRLSAIYCTHSHADHIGGCRYLQGKTGCRVFIPEEEHCFTRHTILEPSLLFGGYPFAALRHKFLMAEACNAEILTEEALPPGFEAIPLPGHSIGMTAYRTPDDVVFAGDAAAGKESLGKYGISYIYSVSDHLRSLGILGNLKARLFVLSHADPVEDISSLAMYNAEKTRETAGRILGLLSEPMGTESILRRTAEAFGITLDAVQYMLIGSTVRSYLAYLCDSGAVETVFQDGMMLWRRV